MPRFVSFAILLAIILLTGGLLIKVLAGFLLPIFLAVLLVVMFRPLHARFLVKCKGRPRVAAGLTTLSILLIVLLPLTWIVFAAASEGVHLASSFEADAWMVKAKKVTKDLRPKAARAGIELPTDEELVDAANDKVQQYVGPAALGGAQFVANMLVGLAIMTVSLYYFLADGPQMIDSVMRLSPLDEKYERRLLKEFTTVSRAVVLATLLSAVVQGLLAGVGYWIAGMPLVFLLTLLTMILALVPFVGAAAVWVPCSIWLYVSEDRAGAAIALAVYGGLVVSMADNLIKPMVLAGRSNLHPLLALLSVLGGVQALGPLGIVVGPMLVAFLQALLTMLQSELEEWEKQTAAP